MPERQMWARVSADAVVDVLQHEGVYLLDADRRIVAWSRSAERMTGFPASAAVGRRCQDDILAHTDLDGRPLCKSDCPALQTLSHGICCNAQVLMHRSDGTLLPIAVRTVPLVVQGQPMVLETFVDRGMEELAELRNMSLVDALTGLCNRSTAERAIDLAVAAARRYGDVMGLLLIDADNFKPINDAEGYQAGDRVLQQIGRALSKHARRSDLVSRWGGDEFVMLTRGCGDTAALRRAAERARDAVAKDVDLREHKITVSVGAALLSKHDTAASLFARANMALREAKKTRDCCVCSEMV